MPFTEKDLRAMLEDNSSTPPPTGDLAATARARGRRTRRRRQAAGGALAAAALVALGFTVVPSLTDDGPSRDVLASATARSAASGGRPDVDLASLPRSRTPWSFFHGLGDIRSADGPLPTPTPVTTENGRIVYQGVSPLSAQSVVGTVEGFASASDPDGKGRGVEMKVRLGAQIDDPARLEERGLREGEVVTLWAGLVDDEKGDPSEALQRAVPKGTRVLAFERVAGPAAPPADPPASPSEPTASPADPTVTPSVPAEPPSDPTASPSDPAAPPSENVRRVQSVVFEDADGSPVAGPYFHGTPDGEWKQPKSFDALLELMRKAVYTCVTVTLDGPADEKALKDLSSKLGDDGTPEKAKCLRVHSSDPSGDPAVSPGVPVPTSSPAAPGEEPPAEPDADRPAEPVPTPAAPEEDRPGEPVPTPSVPEEERPAEPAPASPAS